MIGGEEERRGLVESFLNIARAITMRTMIVDGRVKLLTLIWIHRSFV